MPVVAGVPGHRRWRAGKASADANPREPREGAVARLTASLAGSSRRIDTAAVKQSESRNALRLRKRTPDDFIRGFCRGRPDTAASANL